MNFREYLECTSGKEKKKVRMFSPTLLLYCKIEIELGKCTWIGVLKKVIVSNEKWYGEANCNITSFTLKLIYPTHQLM